jgi:heme A synthase
MVPIVESLHLYNMILVLAVSTITGIWGLVLYFQRKNFIPQPWKIALIVTAIVGLLQALLGGTLVLMGQRAPGGNNYWLHYVYGAIVALAIPVAYTYTSKRIRTTILILSLAALIIAAAGARGMMTGLGIGG